MKKTSRESLLELHAIKHERDTLKKVNLLKAKQHFSLKYINPCTPLELKKWLLENRYRSWKQKGLKGDYFTTNHRIMWFKDEMKLAYLLLAF